MPLRPGDTNQEVGYPKQPEPQPSTYATKKVTNTIMTLRN